MKAEQMFLRREEGETIEDFINREHQHSRKQLAMEARITRLWMRQVNESNQMLFEKFQAENQSIWEDIKFELHGIRGILGNMNATLKSMDGKLDSMDGKLDTIILKLDSMDGKLDTIIHTTGNIDRKLKDGPAPGSNGHGKKEENSG